MAYRRCVSVRAALFARRSIPSFGYFSPENDRQKTEEFRPNIQEYLPQNTLFGSNFKSSSWRYCGSVFREGSGLAGAALCMSRYMSTSIRDAATVLTDAPTEVSTMSEVGTVLTDAPMEAATSQVQAISEVAIAAADSAFPVAAVQYMIDGVHSFTGLNWWASIALTTLLFRGATLPLTIFEHKNAAKLALALPPLKECLEILRAEAHSEDDKVNPKLKAIVYKCSRVGMTAITLFLIRGFVFVDFYLAITNMVEQVPSFTNGGAFWFTDLTTPDAMFILPFLTSLTIFSRFHVMMLIQSNSFKKELRVWHAVAALSCGVLLSTMNFPQALHFHWIAGSVFHTCYLYCVNLVGVKKALGFPGQVRKP